jgi:solute carrier family 8 (sodium/calcium exchanger)
MLLIELFGFIHRSIVSHLYWSAATSSSPEEIVEKYQSIINHVTDIHEHFDHVIFKNCAHGEDLARYYYIQPGSEAEVQLEKIICAPRMMNTVRRLSLSGSTTSELEAFHSNLNLFASKDLNLEYPAMLCR